jgi:hypothetical protein
MKQLITAVVIGLLVVLFVPHQQKDVPPPRPPIQQAIVGEPSLSAKEFPYSVVRGGVHNANDAQLAMGDKVVKLHYTGIDTRRLEATAFKTNAVRYVSYRVSDQIFWTAKPVTIKAGEPVLCDGRNFIRARCGNRISKHPMQPTRQNEPSEEEFDTPIPEHSESWITPPSLTNMFTPGLWDQEGLIEQPNEQVTSATTLVPGPWPGGYIIPPSTPPPVFAPGPPGVSPVGPPVVPPVSPPVVPPVGPPVVPPVVPPVGPPVVPPVGPPVVPPVGPPAVPPVGPPVVPPVSPPVVPPVGPPVVPPVGPAVVPPVGPPVVPPVGPPVVPPVGPPMVPPLGPPIEPPIGPPIEPPNGPPIEPPIIPPTVPPPSVITPESNSFVLFGGVLVLGIAIAGIKMLRDGLRKH